MKIDAVVESLKPAAVKMTLGDGMPFWIYFWSEANAAAFVKELERLNAWAEAGMEWLGSTGSDPENAT